MPDRREIARTARELLGRIAFFGFREYGLLAKLLQPGERIDAMALTRLRGGGLIGSQRLVVATGTRVLLVEKGFVTGRERVRELAWDEIEQATPKPPQALDVQLAGGERIAFHLVQPPRQLGAIADLVRARREPDRAATPTSSELLDLLRSRLGRWLGAALDAHAIALAALLDPGEGVLDVAWSSGKPDSLVAVTAQRLVVLPSHRSGVGEAVSLSRDRIRRVELTDRDELVVDDGGDELVLGPLVPAERGEALAVRLRPR